MHTDSWKGYSALEVIAQSPQTERTELRSFILKLLLLRGADIHSKEVLESAMEAKNLEVISTILTWEMTGRQAGS